MPDFVTKADFEWAVEEAAKKKKTDFSKVEFLTYDEGLCVQCMHIGSYDNEPATLVLMQKFMDVKVSEGVTYECNQDAYEDFKAYYDKKLKVAGQAGKEQTAFYKDIGEKAR